MFTGQRVNNYGAARRRIEFLIADNYSDEPVSKYSASWDKIAAVLLGLGSLKNTYTNVR